MFQTKASCRMLFLVFLPACIYAVENTKMMILRRNNASEPNKQMLVVSWLNDEGKGCEIFDDQNLVAELLKSTSVPQIRNVSDSYAKEVFRKCKGGNIRRKRQLYPDYSTSWGSYGTRMGQSWRSYVPQPMPIRRSNFRVNRRETSRRLEYQEARRVNDQTTPSYTDESRRGESSRRYANANQSLKSQNDRTTTSTTEASPTDHTEANDDETGSGGILGIWRGIFPGTKWCGPGKTATNYSDLGILVDTDKCCRAHDLCNDTISAGETKHNLTNNTPFTQLSCQCDEEFYDCLEKVDSVASNKIGSIYFNILRKDCYAYDYPETSQCANYRSLLKITCKEYARNTSASKVYLYRNPKTYRKLPIPGPIHVSLPSIF